MIMNHKIKKAEANIKPKKLTKKQLKLIEEENKKDKKIRIIERIILAVLVLASCGLFYVTLVNKKMQNPLQL